jgi:hypothetical protein
LAEKIGFSRFRARQLQILPFVRLSLSRTVDEQNNNARLQILLIAILTFMPIYQNKLVYINEVVYGVRREFEQRRTPRSLLAGLYLAYNPATGDINAFLDRAARLFPTGNCGLASIYLQHRLRIGKLEKGKYDGNDHTFLNLKGFITEKALIIDITTDQFRGPAVYVGEYIKPWVESLSTLDSQKRNSPRLES